MMMFKTKSSQLTIVIFVFLVTTSFIFKSTIKLPEVFGTELEPVQANPITNNFFSDSIEIITEEFNQEELIQLLKDLNVKYPHIVLAQSILETGHYKSKVFKENHNLFGMKEARVRIHTAKGTKNGHAYYENWKESVYDYAFYQSTYYSDVRSENQYYRKLDRSYAEAKNYINSVKEIVERENLTQKFLDK
jgi:uncharacterized FlgJ-related protein